MSLSKALSLASAWLDGDENPPPPLFDYDAIFDNSGRSIAADDDDVGPTATTTPRLTTTVSPIERAISLLLKIQTQTESRSITISNNESLEDASTPSLELMSVPYHLGRAYLMLPTTNMKTIPIPTTTSNNYNEKDHDNDSNNNDHGDNHNNSSCSSSQVVQMVGGNSNPSLVRKHNVTQAMKYFHSFLKQLDQLSGSNNNDGILSEGALKEYHALLDDCEQQQQDEEEQDQQGFNHRSPPPPLLDPNQIRTMKIQRYQRKKNAQAQKQQLTSLIQRRSRLGLSDNEYLGDHDQESLLRSLHMETLRIYAEEALEEISASMRELEMIELSINYCNDGSGGNNMASRSGNPKSSGHGGGRGSAIRDGRVSSSSSASHHSRLTDALPPPPRSLQMTQITQNPITGQLQLTKQQVTNGGRLQTILPHSSSSTTTQILQRQQIKEGVFHPGWNLPTMSLEELANRETYEAMQRSEAQKLADAEAIYKPRRYDQLERDGMEDDANLVEASAQLDREWDSWKEENPRGCGNKLGERGDRNF